MATSPSPPQRRRGETRVSINCDLRDVEAAARVWNPAFFSPPVSPRSAYEGSLVSPSSGKQYYLALMIFASVSQFHIYLKCLQSRRLFSSVFNVKMLENAFNLKRALVWTFSMIVKSLFFRHATAGVPPALLQAPRGGGHGLWCWGRGSAGMTLPVPLPPLPLPPGLHGLLELPPLPHGRGVQTLPHPGVGDS